MPNPKVPDHPRPAGVPAARPTQTAPNIQPLVRAEAPGGARVVSSRPATVSRGTSRGGGQGGQSEHSWGGDESVQPQPASRERGGGQQQLPGVGVVAGSRRTKTMPPRRPAAENTAGSAARHGAPAAADWWRWPVVASRAMNTTTSPAGCRVITADEAEARFDAGADLQYPYQDFADEQEIRLYEGGLHVAGSLEREGGDDWSPCNVIVDGDLTVDGDLRWWDFASGSFLLVTGDLRARNVLLSGCPDVVVRGDLTVTTGIHGHHGDDGGCLTVKGLVRAEIVISTLYFNLDFAPHTNAPVIDTTDELNALVLSELLDRDGQADADKISESLSAGRPVLRPGVRLLRPAPLDE